MSVANIVCPACGKEYTWQQQLAGHTVRCTCGQVMPVPAIAAETDSVYALAPSEDAKYMRAVVGTGLLDADSDAGLPCPSCGQPIEFGGVLCKFCGYNVKTGLHDPRAVAPAPPIVQTFKGDHEPAKAPHAHPPAAPVAVPAYAPTISVRKEVETETRQQILKRYLSILGVIVGLIVVVALIKTLRSGAVPEGMTAEDVAIAKKLESDLTLEPQRWLDIDPQRQLGRFNRQQANAWIKQIYDTGAKKVWCYGPRAAPEIYAQPPAPNAVEERAKFFKWYEIHCGENGVSAFPDIGQKYLRIEIPK